MKQKSLEVIYTPSSQIYHPVQLFREMCRDLVRSHELGWQMLTRDINAQYRDSFLGIIWALVPPAVTAAGFAFANNSGIINVGATDIPYPAFVMLGTTLWQTFVEACNGPQQAIQNYRLLFLQVKIPYEAIIWSQLGQITFNLIIKLIFVVLIFIIFKVPVSWMIIFAPVALLSLIIFGMALGLFLIPVLNLVQDVSRTFQFGIVAWFFLTPVAFPVPNNGILSLIIQINPVTPLLITAREMITTGNLTALVPFCCVSIISLIALVGGWVIFRLSMPFIAERIS